MALENLRDGDGNEITPEAHATCPGRAVTITYDWDWAPGAEAAYRAAHDLADDDEIDVEFGPTTRRPRGRVRPGWQIGRYLCTDPEQYGHTNVYGTPRETPTPEQQTAEDEAAEAARADRGTPPGPATEHRVAGRDRDPHVPPQGACWPARPRQRARLKLIVEAMARGETQPLMSSFGHQTACELLGLTGDGAATGYRDLLLAELARASDKRAQVIALAMVLGAAEHGVRDVHTWQAAEDSYWSAYGVPAAARYLAWLAEHTDYSLSDIEAEVAAHATGRAARTEDDGAGQTQASAETAKPPRTCPSGLPPGGHGRGWHVPAKWPGQAYSEAAAYPGFVRAAA